jgi:hypothetical protein
MSLFEQATRSKLRFDTTKGMLTVEDLWDLPLISKSGAQVNLDDLARAAYKEMEEGAWQSFVQRSTKTSEIAKLRFDIIKHIIDVKLADRDAASERAEKAAKKQRILELIATKEDESLAGKSLEELQKLAGEL